MMLSNCFSLRIYPNNSIDHTTNQQIFKKMKKLPEYRNKLKYLVKTIYKSYIYIVKICSGSTGSKRNSTGTNVLLCSGNVPASRNNINISVSIANKCLQPINYEKVFRSVPALPEQPQALQLQSFSFLTEILFRCSGIFSNFGKFYFKRGNQLMYLTEQEEEKRRELAAEIFLNHDQATIREWLTVQEDIDYKNDMRNRLNQLKELRRQENVKFQHHQ